MEWSSFKPSPATKQHEIVKLRCSPKTIVKKKRKKPHLHIAQLTKLNRIESIHGIFNKAKAWCLNWRNLIEENTNFIWKYSLSFFISPLQSQSFWKSKSKYGMGAIFLTHKKKKPLVCDAFRLLIRFCGSRISHGLLILDLAVLSELWNQHLDGGVSAKAFTKILRWIGSASARLRTLAAKLGCFSHACLTEVKSCSWETALEASRQTRRPCPWLWPCRLHSLCPWNAAISAPSSSPSSSTSLASTAISKIFWSSISIRLCVYIGCAF